MKRTILKIARLGWFSIHLLCISLIVDSWQTLGTSLLLQSSVCVPIVWECWKLDDVEQIQVAVRLQDGWKWPWTSPVSRKTFLSSGQGSGWDFWAGLLLSGLALAWNAESPLVNLQQLPKQNPTASPCNAEQGSPCLHFPVTEGLGVLVVYQQERLLLEMRTLKSSLAHPSEFGYCARTTVPRRVTRDP